MAVVIQIENLVKRYKELVALDHLNLEVEEGEIFGLLGPNGSGKSTTINCILALLKYDKGTVKVFGREMKPDSYDIKKEIGVVMQDVAVFDELTVYENVDYYTQWGTLQLRIAERSLFLSICHMKEIPEEKAV